MISFLLQRELRELVVCGKKEFGYNYFIPAPARPQRAGAGAGARAGAKDKLRASAARAMQEAQR
jgi:hypothetical protein